MVFSGGGNIINPDGAWGYGGTNRVFDPVTQSDFAVNIIEYAAVTIVFFGVFFLSFLGLYFVIKRVRR